MTNHEFLRSATAPLHDRVDATFASFSLDSVADYTRFLRAHAAALAAAEAALSDAGTLPAWRPRLPSIRADLDALGVAMPAPLPFDRPSDTAAALGLLYVLEGSRLGGSVLARRVGQGLPGAYLGARHEAGEWRALLARLDAAGDGSDAWRARLLAGAEAAFDLFHRAAATPA